MLAHRTKEQSTESTRPSGAEYEQFRTLGCIQDRRRWVSLNYERFYITRELRSKSSFECSSLDVFRIDLRIDLFGKDERPEHQWPLPGRDHSQHRVRRFDIVGSPVERTK